MNTILSVRQMDWHDVLRKWQQNYEPGHDLKHLSICNQGSDRAVLCLGDSWTYGDSLDEDTRLSQIYGRLIADYLNADLINLGCRGYSNSWVLTVGEMLLENILNRSYKDIYVIITLTENGRDIQNAASFRFDYIQHFKSGVSKDRYEDLLKKIEQYWLKQLRSMISKHNRSKFFVGQNFVWHPIYEEIQELGVHTTDQNWIEILADHQNIARPDRTNLVTRWVFDQVLESNRIAEITDDSMFKSWILPYLDAANRVNSWLDLSNLNFKIASKHPTAQGHRFWADHIIEKMRL